MWYEADEQEMPLSEIIDEIAVFELIMKQYDDDEVELFFVIIIVVERIDEVDEVQVLIVAETMVTDDLEQLVNEMVEGHDIVIHDDDEVELEVVEMITQEIEVIIIDDEVEPEFRAV